MRSATQASAFALIIASGLAASPAAAQSVQNLIALQGLVPFAALPNTAAGQQAVLDNLTVTAGIQNGSSGQPVLRGSFSAQQEQALKDAVETAANAYQLADGLGSTLAEAYRSRTGYTTYLGVSPAVNTSSTTPTASRTRIRAQPSTSSAT